MNVIIHDYEIVLSTYHGEPAVRLRFSRNGGQEESALYSVEEINNTIMMWKMGAQLGRFAIGTILADDATFQIVGRTE